METLTQTETTLENKIADKSAEKNRTGKSANLSVSELGTLLSKSARPGTGSAADADAAKARSKSSSEGKTPQNGEAANNGKSQTVSAPNEEKREDEQPGKRGDGEEAPATGSGQGQPLTAAAFKAGIQTLGLTAEQTTAVEALVKTGGELDADALKLTPEQEAGLTKLFTAPAAAEAVEEHEEEIPEGDATKRALPPELVEAIAELKGAGEQGKAKLLKRVHVVVDQRDTERMGRLAAERDNETLRAQVEQLAAGRQPEGAAVSEDPVANHPEVQKVAQSLATLDAYLDWAEQNPDGGEMADGKGGKTFIDAATVAKIKRNGERGRTELLVLKQSAESNVRQQHADASRQFHGQAVKLYPWLADTKSEQYAHMNKMFEALPGLKSFPDRELVIGRYMRGLELERVATAAGNGNGKAKRLVKIPARVVAELGELAPLSEENGDGAKEQKQFEKTGRVKDLASSFAAKRRNNLARR